MENKDYSISWKYVVEMMEKKFGIAPDSEQRMSMGRIEHLIDRIWDDYFNEVRKGELK